MPSSFEPSIIPMPSKIDVYPDQFELTTEVKILCNSDTESIADYLIHLISPATQFELIKCNENEEIVGEQTIQFELNAEFERLGPEGYCLEISPTQIKISAFRSAGLFYGVQTLRQLLPTEIESKTPVSNIPWIVPCLFIEDIPRFSWRGFMFDEGRHFHGKDTVKHFLDLMAFLKLNIFHWHLTEDQGWRIEIKKYPKLTEIGSKRGKIQPSLIFSSKRGFKPVPQGLFYTQTDIQEIIEYATQRFITIIPEIEMPGHSQAALASYPELGCTGGPYQVSTHFGIHKDIYCVGKDNTIAFLQDVLLEIMALFPSNIIHIGGDEAPKDRWNQCPNCQRRIKAEQLRDGKALQTAFTNQIALFLESRNHRLMGWNEILDENLTLNAIGQFWTGNVDPIIAHLQKGRNFVVSNNKFMYLDHSYANTSLQQAYEYEPLPQTLDPSLSSFVLGIEAPLWTEWVPTRKRAEFQAFPRLIAFAETGWTPQASKNFPSFHTRLANFEARLDLLKVRYAKDSEIASSSFQKFIGKMFPFALSSHVLNLK